MRALGLTHNTRTPARRGKVLIGCLVALVLVVLLIVGGGVYVAMSWRGWTASFAEKIATEAIQSSDLPEGEKGEVLVEIKRLTDGFRSGDVTFAQLEQIGKDIAEGPLIPAAIVGGFEAMYLAPSGLSDEEKQAGGLALSRVAQAVSADKIEADPLANIFDPIQTVSSTGSGVHINHPEFNLHLKDPDDCTDDELREVIANAQAAADEAGMPNERLEIDASEELRAVIDRVLNGETPAIEGP